MAIVTVDFDGTLFQGNSFNVMFKAGQREFTYKQWRTVYGNLTKAAFLGTVKGKQAFRHQFFKGFAKTFKGKTEEELDYFFETLVELGEKEVHYDLLEKVKDHQAKGDEIILLSGALKPFLKAFIKKLGLDVHIIGTDLMYYPNKICTGEIGPIVNGDEKVKKVKEWIFHNKKKGYLPQADQQMIWAYADSESDIPLLEFVHYPVVVNPKADLKTVAFQRKWPILAS